MKRVVLLLGYCLWVFGGYANSTQLLMRGEEGADLNISRQWAKRDQFKLDDAFLIQFFSAWKAQTSLNSVANAWMEAFFSGDYLPALQTLPTLRGSGVARLRAAAELYLLYRLGHTQSFLRKWIEHSGQRNFLQTELGLALDRVLEPHISSLVANSGFYLTPEQEKKLIKIKAQSSVVNHFLQGLRAASSGHEAIRWIGGLPAEDPLRLHLAFSALLTYARQGKLGASGKLLNQVIDPQMEKNQNAEDIAFYYLTVARLLYQAQEWGEAERFYYLIPESSQYFVQARTEVLWIHLRQRRFSKIKGELATLQLDIFNDRFYPEVFLIGTMADVMLCHFSAARKNIHRFVNINTKWAQKIERELQNSNPSIVNETFAIRHWKGALASLKKEQLALREQQIPRYEKDLTFLGQKIEDALLEEARLQWRNRKKILEETLYKMSFVRVELLSRVRAFRRGVGREVLTGQASGQDQIQFYSAAPARGNRLVFPADGHLWGDELFNMDARVKNGCFIERRPGEK